MFNLVCIILFMISDISELQCTRELCSPVNMKNKLSKNTFQQAKPKLINPFNVVILHEMYAPSMMHCITICCHDQRCDSINYYNSRCFLFTCGNLYNCQPKFESNLNKNSFYVAINDDIVDINLMSSFHDPSSHLNEKNEINKNVEITVKASTTMMSTSKEVHDEAEVAATTPIKLKTTVPAKRSILPTVTRMDAATTTLAPAVVATMGSHKLGLIADAGPNKTVRVTQGYSRTISIVSVHGVCRHNSRLNERKITYQWNRLPESVATGRVLNDSDRSGTLVLTELLPGRLVLQLNVSAGGEFASDQMTLTVVEAQDKISMNLVTIILKTSVYKFTEHEKNNMAIRFQHIIEKHMNLPEPKVLIEKVTATYLNETEITFFATYLNKTSKKTHIINGGKLEKSLKRKLMKNKYIVDYSVRSFMSKVCYFDCDNHGKCCPVTHECICRFPWLNNAWRQSQTGIPNCNLHFILIVVGLMALLFIFVVTCLVCKKISKKCRRRSTYGNDTLKYKLLETSG